MNPYGLDCYPMVPWGLSWYCMVHNEPLWSHRVLLGHLMVPYNTLLPFWNLMVLYNLFDQLCVCIILSGLHHCPVWTLRSPRIHYSPLRNGKSKVRKKGKESKPKTKLVVMNTKICFHVVMEFVTTSLEMVALFIPFLINILIHYLNKFCIKYIICINSVLSDIKTQSTTDS